MQFRLARPVFLLFLAGSMIPVHVTLIPAYVLSKNLGIYDSLWALLGPYIGFQLPSLPVIGLYLGAQDRVVAGLTAGAVKG